MTIHNPQPWQYLWYRQSLSMPDDNYLRWQEGEPPTDLAHLAHEAAVEDVIHQGLEWRVKYQGVFWRARCPGAQVFLWPGDRVYVVGRQGNTLLIKPLLAETTVGGLES